MAEVREVGSSGIKVSAIGVGTHQWGNKHLGYGKLFGRSDLKAIYLTLLDAGISFFDTSENYGGGLAEQFLGEFQRDDGRPIVVASKYSPAKFYDPSLRFTAKSTMNTLDESLKRLGTRTMELYQLHYPVAKRRLPGYLDALAETVKCGKVKHLGVCNFNPEGLRRAFDYLWDRHDIRLVSNQIDFSILSRNPEKNGMLKLCEELDIAVLALLPFEEGVLTGKYRNATEQPSRVVRTILKAGSLDMFKQEPTRRPLMDRLRSEPIALQPDKLEPLFEVLDSIAAAHDASLAQVALNWLRAVHPRVIPIPGAQIPDHAKDNAAALAWELAPEEFKLICDTEEKVRATLR